jgi:hypothetical protein
MYEIEILAPNEPNPITAPGLTQWQRVTNTFTAPSKTFEDIKRDNQSWWMPLIILSLVSYLLFAAIFVKIGIQQTVENQMHFNPKAEAQLAQASPAQRDMGLKIGVYSTEGSFIASPVLVLAYAAVLALGLWGTVNFAFGGKATFKGIFAVLMYAWLPGIIKSLLGTAVIFGVAPESFNIKNFAPTNLGAFLDPIETNKALYALATSLDVTTIWTLVLLGIGTAIVAGVKRSSGYIAVFGWWAIYVLASAGIAAFQG